MPPVVGRQVNAVGLVVGRHHDAADVEDAMLAQVLLVDPQHVRRRGHERFHVGVEFEAVGFAHVLCFEILSTTLLRNPLNRPSICCGETSTKFHAPTAYLTGSSRVSLPMP